jgi:hypothetical protein
MQKTDTKICPTCGQTILPRFIANTVHTWMWVRFRIPREVETDRVIRIKGITGKRKNDSPIGDWIWNGVYPIDSSFYPMAGDGDLQLPLPQMFAIHGITFMFGAECDNEDRGKLKDNYIYQLWIDQKWFHQGPMRMFPLIMNMEGWPEVRLPRDLDLPWLDQWDEHLLIPSQCPVSIELEGIPFTPMADMNVVMGIVGDYVRAVQ